MSQVPAMLVVACLAVHALPALRLVAAALRVRRRTVRPD